ncbi:alpha/beta hydrolase family protein [Armatimonas rosea]|uniref:Dienelactone hydrolase n=1 Tax=Armatimonas rosea TaxID=685828 RepID=A0A7W9W7G5_ARMRO|nr:alpha/beta fold hydrolase [Armatimonas rosea]MBB6051196.1 dienelactone hydrolase [Armatimonas rosea]
MDARSPLTAGLLLFLALSGCASRRESPGLELQAQDYRTARNQFKTTLLQKGPAPQPAQAFALPADATLVGYSKALPLKALVGPVPRDGKKRPAVLFLHGGFAMDGSDWEASQAYRDAGYVVMTPMLRGENGQPGAYSLFYDELSDVLAAAETLAALPYVDKTHLYVAGHSVGGTLALLAALSSNRFRAAAGFSGACDAIAWSQGQEELIPFDPKNKREFELRSPIAFATSFQCPTRIYYGTQERLFAGMSQRTAELAKTKKLDVEAVAVPGDHFSAFDQEVTRSIAFFQSH